MFQILDCLWSSKAIRNNMCVPSIYSVCSSLVHYYFKLSPDFIVLEITLMARAGVVDNSFELLKPNKAMKD